MATNKKFYAIAVGRNPGIYDNWPAAHREVIGFTGARYKGFLTRQEAEAWIKNPAPARFTHACKHDATSSAPNSPPKADEVTIYSDGGALRNPGPGGYGIVQIYNGTRKEMSGGYNLTTNNRMELMGCIVALRNLEQKGKPVTLYTDSSYVVNGISKGWALKWRKNGWIKSDNTPAINPDLWGELLNLIEGLNITFKWVKGHAGNQFNERCDQLATAFAMKTGLPTDTGYKKGP